jgi:eukaryotic-like serine/threonine-protein kinase
MDSNSQREQSLFEAALDLPDEAARRAFLDQACKGDAALRERIERLISLSKNADIFFTGCDPALKAAAADADAGQIPSASQSVLNMEARLSSRIGPYKLLEKIGEGGYGIVYMAEQERPVRRRVALKIIKLGMDTKLVIARFEAERQALALMDHPNIARVLDAGATETGRPYFVMELVYGVQITKFCDQNRLGMAQRLELFIQVCLAVQHAHQKGIIHRDLKPSNILVTMRDSVPVPKVIDFGIAKATGQSLTDKTLFTGYAQLLGTPAYMSPEQMEFSTLNLDTRSDIYSLGVLLYELLVGCTPFDTTALLKSGLDELKRTVREQEPLSPSAKLKTLGNDEITKTARMRQVEPPHLLHQLHGDLDWIVMKCLEKDRTRRYDTVNLLAMDLNRYMQQQPVLARPPSQWYRLQKFTVRHRLAILFGVAVSVTLILATVVSTYLFFNEREARHSEETLRRAAEAQEKASHIALLVTQRRFDEADRRLGDIPMNKPSIEAAAELRALGEWHVANGRWREAAERFASLAKVDQLDDSDTFSADRLDLAAALLMTDDRAGYENFRRNALTGLASGKTGSDCWIFKAVLALPCNTNMLEVLGPAAEDPENRFHFSKRGPLPPGGPEWSQALGLFEYRRGRYPQSLDWCSESELNPVFDASRFANTAFVQALSQWQSGDYKLAVVSWTSGYELLQAESRYLNLSLGRSHLFPGPFAPEDLTGHWYDWVFSKYLMRECDDMLTQYERSIKPTSTATPTPDEFEILRALGNWHCICGEWASARNCFERVIAAKESDENQASEDYFYYALALANLRDNAALAGCRDAALLRFENANDESIALNVVKTCLLCPGGRVAPAALDHFVQVLDRSVANDSPLKHGIVTEASWDLLALGLSEYRNGDYSKAIEHCRVSLDTSTYMAIPAATDEAVIAMCLHKLGNESAARSQLDDAISTGESGIDRGFDSWNWREWAFYRLLLHEAKISIHLAPSSASDSKAQ